MGIKAFIKNFIKTGSMAEPINDRSDYRRVKKWVKKVRKMYIGFSVIAVVFSLLLLAWATLLGTVLQRIGALAMFPMMLLTCWGWATMILYYPQILQTIIKTGSFGLKAGQGIETTHVDVKHEYGDTYSVSSHTENKGCLGAVIGGLVGLAGWVMICTYIGSFVIFKKIRNSESNLRNFSEK